MADNKNSFIVYADDIKETLDDLNDDQVAALFRGMVDYQITGKAPKFSGVLKFVFVPIRQQMDRNNEKWQQIKEKRAASGRKGGINSGKVRNSKKEANEANASSGNPVNSRDSENAETENEANEAVNVNVNDNVNVKGNVNVSDSLAAVSDDPRALSSLLVSYLNQKAGTNYRTTGEITERIGEILSDGYTPEDMRRVIDNKVAEWLNDEKMRGYLRPRTLFGDKFEEYADAPDPIGVEDQKKRETRVVELKKRRDSEASALSEVLSKMDVIRGKPGGIKGNYDEWRDASDEKAIREQNIEKLDTRIRRLGT